MSGDIQYLEGDATQPQASGKQLIVHVCNDVGGWGAGFVLALSRRWKEPERAYRQWYKRGEDFELGAVQFVQVESTLWVANLIGQRGLRRTAEGPPIRYPAVERGLGEVAQKAQELCASVHMPRIGCGLAGGCWETIEALIRKQLLQSGVSVTVYDLPSR